MASSTLELEAAIAALPAKKQRLRESFDRLLAASPIPIPFTWADVDAHISSLQSSIARRFRLLQAHQAAALRTTAEHQRQHHVRGKGQDSSEEEEEDGGRPNRAPLDLNAGEEGEQGGAEMAIEASPDQYDAVEEGEASPGLEPEEVEAFLGLEPEEEEEEEKDGERAKRAPSDLNAGEEGEQGRVELAIEGSADQYDAIEEGEASPGLEPEEEEDGGRAKRAPSDLTDEEEGEQGRVEVAIEASPDQDDAVAEGEASPDQDDAVEDWEASPGLEPEEEEEEEEEEETILGAYPSHRHGETKEKAPSSSPTPDPAGGAGGAGGWNLAAARADRDASLLADMLYWGNKRSLRARRQFLPALLCAAEPHALVVGAVRDFLARTEPKSDKNWENCASLLCCVPSLRAEPSAATSGSGPAGWRRTGGRLSSASLKAAGTSAGSPYGAFCSFLPHPVDHLTENGQPVDAINQLIENGKLLDAIKLAHDLNLTDKYPPLSLMNDYVEKAKKTAQEILSREGSPDSLNQAMAKQVNALIMSWRAVDEHVDVAHRTGIKAEITQLLHGINENFVLILVINRDANL
uniref:FRIGIDA-like protein n=1 Tax=Aegilops tauschii TaxID=37682 RepID=R7W740_AEGTA